MEWAAPTEEHGLMEYLPWDATITRNSDGGRNRDRIGHRQAHRHEGDGHDHPQPRRGRLHGVGAHREPHRRPAARPAMDQRDGRPGRHQPRLAQDAIRSSRPRRWWCTAPTIRACPPHTASSTGPTTTAACFRIAPPGAAGWAASRCPRPTAAPSRRCTTPTPTKGMVKTFSNKDMPGLKIFGWGPDLNSQRLHRRQFFVRRAMGRHHPHVLGLRLFPPNGALGWTEKWQPVAHTGGVSVASPWGTVSVDGNVAHVLPTRRTEGATLLVTNPATAPPPTTSTPTPTPPPQSLFPAPADRSRCWEPTAQACSRVKVGEIDGRTVVAPLTCVPSPRLKSRTEQGTHGVPLDCIFLSLTYST